MGQAGRRSSGCGLGSDRRSRTTTVAVGLADEAAELGILYRTLLVDADVYGGVVAQVLGVEHLLLLIVCVPSLCVF